MAKKAVVVGVEYYSIVDKLRGCANDAKEIKDSLMANKGFHSRDIVLLIDKFGKHYRRKKVTCDKICAEILRMIDGAVPGDTLVLFLSGHGTPEDEFRPADETNGYFICSDGELISDKFIREALKNMAPNCDFTMMLDACGAGSFKIGRRGILLASCKANQKSITRYNREKKKGGSVFTKSLLKVMKDNRGKNLINGKVFGKSAKMMRAKGLKQVPLLRCTHAQTNQVFVCRD